MKKAKTIILEKNVKMLNTIQAASDTAAADKLAGCVRGKALCSLVLEALYERVRALNGLVGNTGQDLLY